MIVLKMRPLSRKPPTSWNPTSSPLLFFPFATLNAEPGKSTVWKERLLADGRMHEDKRKNSIFVCILQKRTQISWTSISLRDDGPAGRSPGNVRGTQVNRSLGSAHVPCNDSARVVFPNQIRNAVPIDVAHRYNPPSGSHTAGDPSGTLIQIAQRPAHVPHQHRAATDVLPNQIERPVSVHVDRPHHLPTGSIACDPRRTLVSGALRPSHVPHQGCPV